MTWTTTNAAQTRRLRILLHGQSGAGKTYAIRTLPDVSRVALIAAEDGTLSLSDLPIQCRRLAHPRDLASALEQVGGERGAAAFDWVILDSLTAWAENHLANLLLLPNEKGQLDGRAAYGNLARDAVDVIQRLHALPQHVLVLCKTERAIIDGAVLRVPSMPGQQLTHKSPIAHHFDAVWAIHVMGDKGDTYRQIQTDLSADPRCEAKTRDPRGVIQPWEPADLGDLSRRLLGTSEPESGSAAEVD